MTALEIRELQVRYGGTEVLQSLDLTVESGITAVLGSSGCGKTTLLRTIAGFVEPAAGSITVAGVEVVGGSRSVPTRRRGIGYVPQEGALFPHLTVADNIAFGLPRSTRRPPAQLTELVHEALAMVELDPSTADRYPHQLSGGQQQRVALARALAPRPSLVLLDEPFSSLDAGLREETGRAVVRALRAASAAAVLVTHDQGEALSLADQVAVMESGQFLQVAAPATIYLEPADPRIAAFLGHATLMPGTIGADGLGTCALGTVRVRSSRPLSAGAVQLAVRSEQLQIRADGVPGDVVDVSFFGHDATIRLRLGSGEHVTARTPADSVPAPGDRVFVAVSGEVLAFPS